MRWLTTLVVVGVLGGAAAVWATHRTTPDGEARTSRQTARAIGRAIEGGLGGYWEDFRAKMDADAKRRAAEWERTHQKGGRRRHRPTATPVEPDPIRFTLEAKRVFAAPGDTDVPKIPDPGSLADYKKYGIGQERKVEYTTVQFIAGYQAVGPRAVKAALGKLVLRDKDGKALWVERWHHPWESHRPMLPPGYVRYETVADMRTIDKEPHFREILWADPADVRLEWTAHFVAYDDGTVEGDPRAPFDPEGLTYTEVGNGLEYIYGLKPEAASR